MHNSSFFHLRPALSVSALLLACLALGACKHRPVTCTKPGGYEKAESIAPLRIPSGLEAPDTRGALKIPDLNASAATAAPAGTCLDLPPAYSPNARLIAPDTGKKSRRGKQPPPAPAPAPAAPPPEAPR